MKQIIPILLAFLCCCKNNQPTLEKQNGDQGYPNLDKIDSMVTASQASAIKKIILTTDSATNEIQKSFDAALVRFDSLTAYNDELEEKLNDGVSEISNLKNQLTSMLKNRKLTTAERAKAQDLISDLNKEIEKLIRAELIKK